MAWKDYALDMRQINRRTDGGSLFYEKNRKPYSDSRLTVSAYIVWPASNFFTSSMERPANSAIFSSVIVPSASIF